MSQSFVDMMLEFNENQKKKDSEARRILLEKINKDYDAAWKERSKAFKELKVELDELEVRSTYKNKMIRMIESDPLTSNLQNYLTALQEFDTQQFIVLNARLMYEIESDKANKIYAVIDAARRLKNAFNDLITLGYAPKDFE